MKLVVFIICVAAARVASTAKSGSVSSGNANAKSTSRSETSTSTSTSSSSSSSTSSSQSSTSSYTSSNSSNNGTAGRKCGVNEYPVPCMTVCPPQDCEIAYTEYLCDPKPKCEPGCDCIANHLRNKQRICIFNENCPTASPEPEESSNFPSQPTDNSSGSVSSTNTNAQLTSTLESSTSTSSSSSSSSSTSLSQSSASSYTSSSSCEDETEEDGSDRICTYNKCTPTCSLPYPQNCPSDSNPCNCPPGTIISEEGGECVPREECQKYANCRGDYNASISDCPIACPSTCAKPDAEYCNTQCGNLGCACNPGYLLNKINGHCIKPEDCPGGNACGKNEVFIGCSVKCPTIYCPVTDTRAFPICDPARPCPSGCGCQRNYLRKSIKEYICIPASKCPPVNCTRPNEEWNPCPKPCFSDYCRDINRVINPEDCPSFRAECKPQCVCKQGFFRNDTEICVPSQECSSNN